MIRRPLRVTTHLVAAATGVAALALIGITLSVAATRVHSWADVARTLVGLGVSVGLATWLTRPCRTSIVIERRHRAGVQMHLPVRTAPRHVTQPSLEKTNEP